MPVSKHGTEHVLPYKYSGKILQLVYNSIVCASEAKKPMNSLLCKLL